MASEWTRHEAPRVSANHGPGSENQPIRMARVGRPCLLSPNRTRLPRSGTGQPNRIISPASAALPAKKAVAVPAASYLGARLERGFGLSWARGPAFAARLTIDPGCAGVAAGPHVEDCASIVEGKFPPAEPAVNTVHLSRLISWLITAVRIPPLVLYRQVSCQFCPLPPSRLQNVHQLWVRLKG